MEMRIFGLSIEFSYRWRTRLKRWNFDFMPPGGLHANTPLLLTTYSCKTQCAEIA